MTALQQKRAAMAAQAERIDELAMEASALFNQADGSFAAELGIAQAMNDLTVALTDEMMQPVMALMNTPLGFLTDRDPARPVEGKPPPTPYSVEVVRSCFIESKLRGLHAIGNEWNIISGKCYPALNGLERKIKKHIEVTGYREDIGVPRIVADKGAIVPVKATWNRGGKPDSLEADIPVRVNFGMSADAVIGKARRKLYARVLGRLNGRPVDEDDGEAINVQATVTPASTVNFGSAGSAPPTPTPPPSPVQPQAEVKQEAPDWSSRKRKRAQPAPTAEPAPEPVAAAEPEAEPAPEPAQADPPVDAGPVLSTGQQLLTGMWEIVQKNIPGAAFEDLIDYARFKYAARQVDWDALAGIHELPDDIAAGLANSPRVVNPWVRTAVERRNKQAEARAAAGPE